MFASLFSACSPAGRLAQLPILIFHRVQPEPDALFPEEVDAAQFERILSWLGSWFRVLPLNEAAARLRDGTLPARAICITFDDGYADNYTEALPALSRHRMHATFFIATGFLDGGRMWNDTVIESIRRTQSTTLDLTSIGLGIYGTATNGEKRHAIDAIIPQLKYEASAVRAEKAAAVAGIAAVEPPDDLMLTSAQLRELHAAGMGIGAHTVSHPILAQCDIESARDEIQTSRQRLQELIGTRIGLFAYPNGKPGTDYLPEHARLVSELGFDAAVSTSPGASRRGDDTFQLRRFTPWDREKHRFGLRLALNVLSDRLRSRGAN